MRTNLIAAVLFVVAFLGGFYFGGANIASKMGVPLSDLLEQHSLCEKRTGETCRAYGGFAPESMFRDSKKPGTVL